ncbi:hypothetical protein UFOVP29_226 [uncultured Caudovirales phage]|uniref:DNA primase n=1 Tax=uncultured Caudovirales phage TaxID=2100421 RepID=A0A6J5KQH5_9CAUD|nr:hypothetical protein UFOVP29_226 [uncultured Caudovirales phage]
MTSVAEVIRSWLPANNKAANKGWRAANAVCCHHRGHKPDTRNRGNWLIDASNQVSYTCYNCAFRTRYTGDGITDSFAALMAWMGVPQEAVNQLRIDELRKSLEDGTAVTATGSAPGFQIFAPDPLPAGSEEISQLIAQGLQNTDFRMVCDYLQTRGTAVMGNWQYHWAPAGKWIMKQRLIIPFHDHNGRHVGYCARYAGTPPRGIPRYTNSALPPDYLFNTKALYRGRRWAVVVEGVLDAIAIDGVAVLSHQLSRGQIEQLHTSGCEIIVMPDQEQQNQDLIDQAMQQGWSVSFPEWGFGCKDAADATKIYGELYTIRSIIAARTQDELDINVLRQTIGEK